MGSSCFSGIAPRAWENRNCDTHTGSGPACQKQISMLTSRQDGKDPGLSQARSADEGGSPQQLPRQSVMPPRGEGTTPSASSRQEKEALLCKIKMHYFCLLMDKEICTLVDSNHHKDNPFPSPLNLDLKDLKRNLPSFKQSPFQILIPDHPLWGWTKRESTVPMKSFSYSIEEIDLRNQSKCTSLKWWCGRRSLNCIQTRLKQLLGSQNKCRRWRRRTVCPPNGVGWREYGDCVLQKPSKSSGTWTWEIQMEIKKIVKKWLMREKCKRKRGQV